MQQGEGLKVNSRSESESEEGEIVACIGPETG